MMNLVFGIILFTIAALPPCAGFSPPVLLFPSSEEYVYRFLASSGSGFLLPSRARADYTLRGELHVRARPANLLHIRLRELQHSISPALSTAAPHFMDLPLEASAVLSFPLAVVLQGSGAASELRVTREDPLWSVNIKRAIAVALQMQTVGRTLPSAFKVTEGCLHGNCAVEYSVLDEGAGHWTVHKGNAVPTLIASLHHNLWMSMMPDLCAKEIKNPLIGNAEKMYTIDEKGLRRMETTGSVEVHYHKHILQSITNMTLERISIGHTTSEEEEIDEKHKKRLSETHHTTTVTSKQKNHGKSKPKDHGHDGKAMVSVGLAWVPPSEEDPTGGRKKVKPGDNSKIMKMLDVLLRAAEGLEKHGPRDTLLRDKLPLEIYRVMSQMSYLDLQETYKELEVGTSYRRETMRNIFLEALPQGSSAARALLVRDLVLQARTGDEVTALRLLHRLPTTAGAKMPCEMPCHLEECPKKCLESHRDHEDHQDCEQPCVSFLKEMEPLYQMGQEHSDAVRRAGVLAFSSLVFGTYLAGACNADTFEDYVQNYFLKFTVSEEYADRLTWLSGLSNLQLDRVSTYLAPVISGSMGASRHERFIAVWGTMPLAHLFPTEVHNLYWPILRDWRQPLEMRVAAITMLITAEPSPHRFLSLHWYISAQPDPQLKNFFYTTIKSLEHTTFNCYRPLSKLASYLGQLVQSPGPRYWATFNRLADGSDMKRDAGMVLQALGVADEPSGLPGILYIKLVTHNAGLVLHDYSVYLKLQGFGSAAIAKMFSNRAIRNLQSDSTPTALAAIFETIKNGLNEHRLEEEKVPQPYPLLTPLHIEFVLQHKGKTFYALYLNQTTIDKWTKNDYAKKMFENLLVTEAHINHQVVVYPTLLTSVLPSELGTPLQTTTMLSSLTSVRGNLTYSNANGGLGTRNNDLNLRTSALAVLSLSAYNPISDILHTAEVAQVGDLYLPVNFSVGIGEHAVKAIRVNWLNSFGDQAPGLSAYSGAKILLEGQLPSSCEGCQRYVSLPVKGNVMKVNKDWLEVECTGLTDVPDIIWQLITSHSSNTNTMSAAGIFILAAHAMALTALPASGPCRVNVRAPNNGKKTAGRSGTAQLELTEGGRIQATLTTNDVDYKPLSMTNASCRFDYQNDIFKMDAQVKYKALTEASEWAMCVNVEGRLRSEISGARPVGRLAAFSGPSHWQKKEASPPLRLTIAAHPANIDNTDLPYFANGFCLKDPEGSSEVLYEELNKEEETNPHGKPVASQLRLAGVARASQEHDYDFSLDAIGVPEFLGDQARLVHPLTAILGPWPRLSVSDLLSQQLGRRDHRTSLMGSLVGDGLAFSRGDQKPPAGDKTSHKAPPHKQTGIILDGAGEVLRKLFLPTRNVFEFLMAFGLLRECEVVHAGLIDIEGRLQPSSSGAQRECHNSQKILLADSSPALWYGLVSMPGAEESMPLRLYVADNFVDLVVVNQKVNVKINGHAEAVDYLVNSYTHPPDEKFYDFKITGTDKVVTITSVSAMLSLHYRVGDKMSHQSGKIMVPAFYLEQAFGACVNTKQQISTAC